VQLTVRDIYRHRYLPASHIIISALSIRAATYLSSPRLLHWCRLPLRAVQCSAVQCSAVQCSGPPSGPSLSGAVASGGLQSLIRWIPQGKQCSAAELAVDVERMMASVLPPLAATGAAVTVDGRRHSDDSDSDSLSVAQAIGRAELSLSLSISRQQFVQVGHEH
jgi:hypothetical protein